MNTTLSPRLLLCAQFVREGARLADIGTDHAYLPVYLAQKGVISHAVAADINIMPLKRGEDNISKSCLEGKIEARVSNGFETISADEFDDAVIAGMGGDLICRIIDDASDKLKSESKRLILQPMTRAATVRAYLYKNGFEIKEESAVFSEGRVYTVICSEYCGKIKDDFSPADEYIGNLDYTKDADRAYIESVIKGLEAKLNDISQREQAEKIICAVRGACNGKCG